MSLPQHGNRKRNQGGHEDRGQGAGRDALCGPAASWTTQERVEACREHEVHPSAQASAHQTIDPLTPAHWTMRDDPG